MYQPRCNTRVIEREYTVSSRQAAFCPQLSVRTLIPLTLKPSTLDATVVCTSLDRDLARYCVVAILFSSYKSKYSQHELCLQAAAIESGSSLEGVNGAADNADSRPHEDTQAEPHGTESRVAEPEHDAAEAEHQVVEPKSQVPEPDHQAVPRYSANKLERLVAEHVAEREQQSAESRVAEHQQGATERELDLESRLEALHAQLASKDAELAHVAEQLGESSLRLHNCFDCGPIAGCCLNMHLPVVSPFVHLL